jgi:hypothetical protein
MVKLNLPSVELPEDPNSLVEEFEDTIALLEWVAHVAVEGVGVDEQAGGLDEGVHRELFLLQAVGDVFEAAQPGVDFGVFYSDEPAGAGQDGKFWRLVFHIIKSILLEENKW